MSQQSTFMGRAFTSKGLFWIVLIGGLVADLASKAWADAYVRPTDPIVTPIIEGFIGWKWATNEGAAFSILEGRPVVLGLIAAAVLSVLFLYMYKADPKRRWYLAALALVASGAIGNLHDRMLLGHVRDFMFFTFDLPMHGWGFKFWVIDFEIPLKYPVFNVADIAIIAGVILLVLMSLRSPKKKSDAPTETQEAVHGA